MPTGFPLVGVIGPNHLYRSLIGPALALGVDLRLLGSDISTIAQKLPGCDLVTVIGTDFPISTVRNLEAEGVIFRPSSKAQSEVSSRNVDSRLFDEESECIEVLVARSPHAQASVWAPSNLVFRHGLQRLALAPVMGEPEEELARCQSRALKLVREMDVVGVVSVTFRKVEGGFEVFGVSLGPSQAGNWTVDGTITNQFEQHLRAILDLPLGDPSLIAPFAAAGNFIGGEGRDMYRPYLHLMARSPRLKYHQYRDADADFGGHVNCMGDDLLGLTQTIWHALDYMDGEIDE